MTNNDISNNVSSESIEKMDLQQRVQVSNIIYPSDTMFGDDNKLSSTFNIKNTYGMTGLKYVLDGVSNMKFKYLILSAYNRFPNSVKHPQ